MVGSRWSYKNKRTGAYITPSRINDNENPTDPDSGDKTVVMKQNLKGQTDQIAEEISDKLLFALDKNIADEYRV